MVRHRGKSPRLDHLRGHRIGSPETPTSALKTCFQACRGIVLQRRNIATRFIRISKSGLSTNCCANRYRNRNIIVEKNTALLSHHVPFSSPMLPTVGKHAISQKPGMRSLAQSDVIFYVSDPMSDPWSRNTSQATPLWLDRALFEPPNASFATWNPIGEPWNRRSIRSGSIQAQLHVRVQVDQAQAQRGDAGPRRTSFSVAPIA